MAYALIDPPITMNPCIYCKNAYDGEGCIMGLGDTRGRKYVPFCSECWNLGEGYDTPEEACEAWNTEHPLLDESAEVDE